VNVSAAEAWQFSAAATSGNFYPQIGIRMDKVTIEAETRKIGSSYSLETAQDIQAMHDLDMEREIVQVLQYEAIAELDRQILYAMKQASQDTTRGGAVISQINCSGTAALDGRWSQERYANIVAAIMHQSNRIARATRQGPGNFVVCSSGIATIIQASGHPFSALKTSADAGTVMTEIGKVNNRMTCYHDMYSRTEYALIGYKGAGISDAGIIFCPYIMGLTSKAIDPSDFSPRIGVMGRYAVVKSLLGSGRYYRLISFANLSSILASA
jgi:hypothetical protein